MPLLPLTHSTGVKADSMGKPLLTALSFLLVLCQLALPQMGFQIMVVTGQTVIHSGLHDDQSILEDSVIEDATNGVFAVSQSLDRQLQDSSFAYQAKYIANFQVLQDDNCLTAKPVIQIACQGYIQVVNTSNPSILCGTFPTIDESGWSYLRCNNTCSTDSACQDVYLAVGGNSLDGPFGGVEFRCAGDVLEDVEALILIEGRSDGACGLGTSSDSRIFHAAQLGISCPTASGIGSDYVYDDFLFECGSGRSGGRAVVGDRYTCFSGGRCLAGESCEIEVDPLYMNVSLPAVQTKCVNPTVPLPAPAPFSPTPNQPQLFSYKARFTAAWSLYSNQTSETACSSDVATVRIECTNADNLTMIEEPGQRLNCTMVGQVAMDCTKLDGNPANSYFPYIEFVSAMLSRFSLQVYAFLYRLHGFLLSDLISKHAIMNLWWVRNALDQSCLKLRCSTRRQRPHATETASQLIWVTPYNWAFSVPMLTATASTMWKE